MVAEDVTRPRTPQADRGHRRGQVSQVRGAVLGEMIGEGRNYMLTDSWLMTIPGVTIALLVIGLNLLGDGLRDIFDPRLKDD